MEPEGTDKERKIEIDEEGMANLVGFFSLLLKVDRRLHPELYKKPDRDASSGDGEQSPEKPYID